MLDEDVSAKLTPRIINVSQQGCVGWKIGIHNDD